MNICLRYNDAFFSQVNDFDQTKILKSLNYNIRQTILLWFSECVSMMWSGDLVYYSIWSSVKPDLKSTRQSLRPSFINDVCYFTFSSKH